MTELAVIIPAYKEDFFYQALESLRVQSVQNFNVYIGDDCSPYNLKSIVDNFTNDLNISYTRFDANIGSKNLVNQWERCVSLSSDEPWIWLFSDDDIADADCVKNFYEIKAKENDRFDVYRFNTVVIDHAGSVSGVPPRGPAIESSLDLAYNILLGRRGNSMPDHIFSRKIYNENGGFVNTRYAQAADWASSISFAKNNGICIIPHSELYWRYSGKNISSVASKFKNQMITGHLQFIEWVLKNFEYLKEGNAVISYTELKSAALLNLISVMVNHYKGYDFLSFFVLFRFLRKNFDLSIYKTLRKLALIYVRTHPRYFPFLKM